MVTINEVAKRAGVSIATVSNVVNKNGKVALKTKKRVLAAIDELNYIPNSIAKGLKKSQTQNIGIIAEDVSAFSSGDIIDGICEYSEKKNYSISLTNLRVNRKVNQETIFNYEELEKSKIFQDSIKKNLNQLLTFRISGLIYIGVHPRDVGQILPDLDIPIVYTYAYTTKDDYCVNYNDYQGAKAAVEHLIKQNHKKIATISGSVNSVPAHKRLLGYQTALMENNLNYNTEYIKTGNWHYDDGYNQCLKLLNLPDPPTAIFAMSDLMAYGVINAAKDKGISIPENLSIHGFDDLELSNYQRPSLTTIKLPLHKMGLESAKILIKLIEGEEISEKNILLNCKHVQRNSVQKL